MAKLSPSLLSADFYALNKQLDILKKKNIEYLHLDIMDGNFVPNISFGLPIIKSLRKHYSFVFDVHLMIEKPENYIDEFCDSGADILMFHPEATDHVHRVIQKIKSHGKKAGLVLNPQTPLQVLDYVVEDLDQILIMSVNPGFGGQTFIETMYQKLMDTRAYIDRQNSDILLEVDGGIKTTNLERVLKCGVDLVVSGSDVFNDSMESQVSIYQEILQKAL